MFKKAIEGSRRSALRHILKTLKTGSNVEGEVFIQKLIVDSGAIFNANCSMHSEEDGVKKLTTTREKTA